MRTKNLSPTIERMNFWIDEVNEEPTFLNELSVYQIKKLRTYANSRLDEAKKVYRLNPSLRQEITSDSLVDKLERVHSVIDKHEIEDHRESNVKITNKRIIKGFQTNLTDKQIENLYIQMQDKYFDTSPENFNVFLRAGDLDGIIIKWIDKSITRHKPNKSTIYEFLYLLKEYNYIDHKEFDTTPSNQNNLYRKLETVFPDINNFPQSNPFKLQGNTARHKELETIIKSLQS